jgi:hypothetical protein
MFLWPDDLARLGRELEERRLPQPSLGYQQGFGAEVRCLSQILHLLLSCELCIFLVWISKIVEVCVLHGFPESFSFDSM